MTGNGHSAERDLPFPVGGREFLLVCCGFLLAAFAVFGWYAFHGGFVADDWVNASHYYNAPSSGFWSAVQNYQTPSRPVAAVYVSLTYALLGIHIQLHLLLSVVLAAFLSTAFYLFLRSLRVGIGPAVALATLLLVFPSSDSTRLWTTGSQIDLFIGLYLVAMTIAVVGRRKYGAPPTRDAVLFQVMASSIAVVAVAGYEIVAPAVLLSFVLYRYVGRGGVLWRWLLDAIPTLLILVFFTRRFSGGGAHGTQLITNVGTIAEGAWSILGYTLIPDRGITPWPPILIATLIVFVAFLVWRKSPEDPKLKGLGSMLKAIPVAIAATIVGYAMLLPAAEQYPLYAPGVQNRTNCLAALGLCLLVFLLASIVATLIAAFLPGLADRSRTDLRRALTAVAVVGLVAVWTVRVGEDANRWQKAGEVQDEMVAVSRTLVPDPQHGATIFTSPFPGYSAPSIPIFGGGGNNDELDAYKVIYGRPDLRAFPLLEGSEPECRARNVWTPNAGESPTRYGQALLVEARTNTVYRPGDRKDCLRDTRAMEPFGPVNLTNGW